MALAWIQLPSRFSSAGLRSTGLRSTGLGSFEGSGFVRRGFARRGFEGVPSHGGGSCASPLLPAGCLPYAQLPYAQRPRPELVLFVNETSGGRKRRRRGSAPERPRQAHSSPAGPRRAALPPAPSATAPRAASRKAVLRQFARAAARIERSAEYRRSLQVVLELGGELERVLEPAQRERWLALEDALHEHSWRLYRAYFRAGLKYMCERPACAGPSGRSAGPGGAGSGAGSERSGPERVPSPAQLELLAAFARLLGLL